MAKEVGLRARKNHLLNYFNEHFASEEVEILEDFSTEDFPTLKFQTKNRIITLTTDSFGEVSEDFRMRRGAGSKQDFLNKQTAYTALNAYLKSNFPENSIIKTNSFEESVIKIQTDTQIISLLYDFSKNEVYEKTRNRRGTKTQKKESIKEISKKEFIKKETQKENSVIKKYKESFEKVPIDEDLKYIKEENIHKITNEKKIKQNRYKKLTENMKVRNIYNDMVYSVLEDDFGMIRVIDDSKVTHLMTIADLEIV